VAVSFIGGGKPECPEKNTVPIMWDYKILIWKTIRID
jgi:hypothetical protein